MSEEDNNNSNKYSKPVTVIVKRIAKKDRIKEFEEWLSGISKEVSRQEGSMGIDIIRPTHNINSSKSKLEYIVIFRFNNYDNLAKWEKSPIRNEWLQKGRKLVEADPDVQKMTGLEFWFTPNFKDEYSPMIASTTSTTLQNGNCYYSSYLNSAINFGSSNTFFNRNVINTISNKTCYCSYNNSSTNDLCNNAFFDKIIKTLAIQTLIKNALFYYFFNYHDKKDFVIML